MELIGGLDWSECFGMWHVSPPVSHLKKSLKSRIADAENPSRQILTRILAAWDCADHIVGDMAMIYVRTQMCQLMLKWYTYTGSDCRYIFQFYEHEYGNCSRMCGYKFTELNPIIGNSDDLCSWSNFKPIMPRILFEQSSQVCMDFEMRC